MSTSKSTTVHFDYSSISNTPTYNTPLSGIYDTLPPQIGKTSTSKITQLVHDVVIELVKKKEHQDEQLISKIELAVLNHKEVKELLKSPAPINALTKRGIIAIARVCYGGVVSYQSRQPTVKRIVGIAKDFFLTQKPQNVKLGSLINFIKHNPKFNFHVPTISTIRSALTDVIPEKYLDKGRSCTGVYSLINSYFALNPV
ncbi:hypothetical protein C9J41_17800 [Photobacterium sp. GB-50]|uniref:hypothetical protein n=1 Tax=Photobacterium sp. GB-50 TaxID=2022107 RepID=UPI000D158FCB|nr:hypothetical protein [Photobacterium sp. GB-50]PSW72171.1 hypothetical protein C9J41_17800 [Photobacterium sp. GB-50]